MWVFSVFSSNLPAQWGQLAGAAPGVVGQREIGDGAILQASR